MNTTKPVIRKHGAHGTYLDLYPRSEYDPTAYERPVLTVDIAIMRVHDSVLQILLIRRGQDPFKGRWAFPGGYVDISKRESIDAAAARELREETGVKDLSGPLRQFRTYSTATRDPRWYTTDVVYYYLADRDEAAKIRTCAGDDAAEVQWFNIERAISVLSMAFDHNVILRDLRKHLVERVWDPEVFFQLGQRGHNTFTFPELRDVYALVTSTQRLDVSNFRRMLAARYEYTALPGMADSGSKGGRPSRLYELGKAVRGG